MPEGPGLRYENIVYIDVDDDYCKSGKIRSVPFPSAISKVAARPTVIETRETPELEPKNPI